VKGQATMDGVEKEEMAGMLATLMMTRAQLDAAEEIPKQINIQGREGVGKSGGKPPTQCGSTGSCCCCSGNSCCCCCCVVLSVQIRRVHNSAPLGQLLWQLQLQSAVCSLTATTSGNSLLGIKSIALECQPNAATSCQRAANNLISHGRRLHDVASAVAVVVVFYCCGQDGVKWE